MKKEIKANDIIYMIAIFVMPIITFIGVTKLQTDIINISDVIKVGAGDYNTLFLGDMVLFITCWVSLFVSYVLYKTNIKLAQGLILIGSIVFLAYNVYLALRTYGSISSIINPLIVLTASLYALLKPDSYKTLIVSPEPKVKEDEKDDIKVVTTVEEEKDKDKDKDEDKDDDSYVLEVKVEEVEKESNDIKEENKEEKKNNDKIVEPNKQVPAKKKKKNNHKQNNNSKNNKQNNKQNNAKKGPAKSDKK